MLLAVAIPSFAAHALDVHWAKGPGVKTVFLLDLSGGTVPVAEAAQGWNQSSGLRFAVVSDCPPEESCVVVERRPLQHNYLGLTRLETSGQHITSAHVALNSNRAMSPAKLLAVTCHELGHVAGLNHSRTGQSCLVSRGSQGQPTRPDGHDIAELEGLYAHSH